MIASITARTGVRVAVVSGRSLADLARFDFPPAVDLVGSHGMETSSSELRPTRRRRTATGSTPCANWPLTPRRRPATEPGSSRSRRASCCTSARPSRRTGLDARSTRCDRAATAVEGTSAKNGSEVLELFTRSANKGDALVRLARGCSVRCRPCSWATTDRRGSVRRARCHRRDDQGRPGRHDRRHTACTTPTRWPSGCNRLANVLPTDARASSSCVVPGRPKREAVRTARSGRPAGRV